MPRKKRIDYPGTLHHIIVRGINKEKIFRDDQDKNEFLNRLKLGLRKSKCQCMAWVLMSNHFHLLIRTGEKPLTNLMRSLLTSYAIYFNKKNKRCGYVYQGRYKDILCDEESYLLELIRYIHLNPIRAGIIKSIDELEKYKWSGHGAILGNNKNDWQEINEILLRFGKTTGIAKKGYNEFVREGLPMGKRREFSGGGVIRSYGGWEKVKEMKKDKVNWRADDRILG
ncbi:MAG: transposase, partial [Candidatus Firestonebacteria bacterium]|nr:transposase [Candidatus Firestonebacteria bacterium]